MNRYLLAAILLACSFHAGAQRIRGLYFEKLYDEVTSTKDTLVILNFWATWCKPCVEELPAFDRVTKDYPGKKLKMILVNLDFNSRVGSVAEPFILKEGFTSPVWHIKNTDPNEWIDRIDSSWSGAIPATAVYRDGKKIFFREGQMTESELKETITRLSPQ